MNLKRRKPASPEITSRQELDRKLNHLLHRSRKATADWQLFDGRNENRSFLLNWRTFRHSFGNHIVAIASVKINGQTWWVVAERQPQRIDLGALLAFGVFISMLLTPSPDIHFQFWNKDPRTLGVPIWDHLNTPDGVKRTYIKTRKELADLG